MFLGMSLTNMVPIIERAIGRTLPAGWTRSLADRILAALSVDAPLIPGAREALQATTELGLPWRIASNSSPEEMAAKFAANRMTELVAGRTHSARDVAAGKPAPDLFLAAAASAGIAPEYCLVVEDSLPGVRAAIAAGMDCLAHAPHDDGAVLAALGAWPFHAMSEFPALLRSALRVGA